MSGAFGLAGWHFSSNPTSSSSENKIGKAEGTEPWKTGGNAAYQYHPHGDTSKPRKDAPSALNEVIIPNVNLPKVSAIGGLEKYQKSQNIASKKGEIRPWNNQDEVLTNIHSRFTRSTTSGARRVSRRSMRVSESCVNIKSFEDRIERFPCVHRRRFTYLTSWISTIQFPLCCGVRLSILVAEEDAHQPHDSSCLFISGKRIDRTSCCFSNLTIQYHGYALSEQSVTDISNLCSAAFAARCGALTCQHRADATDLK
jgi:hypothetical protein